ncbi:MAG: bifunctional nicotinamidase/pyrazinamidase [Spirochaetota bacterium]
MIRLSSMAALVIIDVQVDFCPGGKLAVAKGDSIIPVINSISGKFPCVVATQDWHPIGHVSFASSHGGKKPFDRVIIDGIEQVLWPEHCVQGTGGADFHPALDTRSVRLILRKGTNPALDSYSAFFENDRKTSTGLEYYLQGLGYSDVFLCGLATDVCVFYTALDALKIGFRTFLIEDGSVGVDVPPGSVGRAKSEMAERGVLIISSSELG